MNTIIKDVRIVKFESGEFPDETGQIRKWSKAVIMDELFALLSLRVTKDDVVAKIKQVSPEDVGDVVVDLVDAKFDKRNGIKGELLEFRKTS